MEKDQAIASLKEMLAQEQTNSQTQQKKTEEDSRKIYALESSLEALE